MKNILTTVHTINKRKSTVQKEKYLKPKIIMITITKTKSYFFITSPVQETGQLKKVFMKKSRVCFLS